MLSHEQGAEAHTCRVALEALRNGVPNSEAVRMLGCNQPEAESQFENLLGAATSADGASGMLVSGEFGSGKSHLLTHLERLALSRGFICSKVAISKETPLYDLGKVFKSAMDNGRMLNHRGRLIEELGQSLDPNSAEYDGFFDWAHLTESNGLSRMFPASLMVHRRSNDFELNNDIENFWAGDRILKGRITRELSADERRGVYAFRMPKAVDLPPQRLRFMLELIKAAGYKGWVVLLDEIELAAQYSLLQRGRSYAELSRWLGQTVGEHYPGLVVVGTVTGDFALEIISPDGTKKDRDYVAPRLEARYGHLVSAAVDGMRLIEQRCIPLNEPSDDDVRSTMDTLREIYSTAYGWDAPTLPVLERGAGLQNRMRYKVRASINEWDLRRLYPDYAPETAVREFHHSYEENTDLERTTSDNADELS